MTKTILKIAVHTHMIPNDRDMLDIVHAVAQALKTLEFAGAPSHNVIQRAYVEDYPGFEVKT